jgi:hypothetical protein
VRKWEYKKIAANEASRRRDDIDLLCDAGEEGWELVTLLPNGVAYLKREMDEDAAGEREERVAQDEPIVAARREERAANGREVKVKYRDPITGDTWTGRGRMASWLKRKQDAGEDIEKADVPRLWHGTRRRRRDSCTAAKV